MQLNIIITKLFDLNYQKLETKNKHLEPAKKVTGALVYSLFFRKETAIFIERKEAVDRRDTFDQHNLKTDH